MPRWAAALPIPPVPFFRTPLSTARAVATDVTNKTESDGAGRFRFPYLPVGQYEITVHRDGFSDAKRTLTLTIGAAFDLTVQLSVGATQTVTVNAEATVLETDRSQIAGTISQNEVANLPLNGRNFLDLALLVPGVSPTNTARQPALRGDLRRAGSRSVCGLAAQLFQLFHR